jgi:hypothetical protein
MEEALLIEAVHTNHETTRSMMMLMMMRMGSAKQRESKRKRPAGWAGSWMAEQRAQGRKAPGDAVTMSPDRKQA